MEYIHAHHEAFMAKYRGFKEPLAEVFGEKAADPKKAKPEADKELMAGVYEKIRMAADDMDCDQLEGIFAEMEEYRIPESEKTLYEELRAATSRFDYEAILKLLEARPQ